MKFIFWQTSKVLKPFYYISSALVLLHFGQSCKKEDTTDTPVVVEAKDHPTTFVLSVPDLPKGVEINSSEKKIVVSETMSDKDIIALFEKGQTEDLDGKSSIKLVTIEGDGALVTLQWVDTSGKTTTTQIKWTIERKGLEVEFPAQLPNVDDLKAGDASLIQHLLSTPLTLSDSSSHIPTVYIDGVQVSNGYAFSRGGNYTLKLEVTDSKGTKHYKEYSLSVKNEEVVVLDFSNYTPVEQPTDILPQVTVTGRRNMEMMGLGNMWRFLQLQITKPHPTAKPVVVLEQAEWGYSGNNHEFLPRSKKLAINIPGIEAKSYFIPNPSSVTPEQAKDIITAKISEQFPLASMILYEDNSWRSWESNWNIDLAPLIRDGGHTNIYVVCDPGGGLWDTDSNDDIAAPGYGITSIPVSTNPNDPLPFYATPGTNPNTYWNSTSQNPLLQVGRDLSFGVPALSHSESTVTASLLIAWIISNENNLRQNQSSPISGRSEVNTLLKQTLKEYYRPAYFSYRDSKGQMQRTNTQVGIVFNYHSYVKHRNFAWNPAITTLTDASERVPIFAHSELLQHQEYILFQKDIGLEQDADTHIWYFSPAKAIRQGYKLSEIQSNSDEYFKFVVVNPNTKEKIFDFTE